MLIPISQTLLRIYHFRNMQVDILTPVRSFLLSQTERPKNPDYHNPYCYYQDPIELSLQKKNFIIVMLQLLSIFIVVIDIQINSYALPKRRNLYKR